MQEQWLNHLKVAGFIATGAGVLLWRRNKNTLVNGLEFIFLESSMKTLLMAMFADPWTTMVNV